MKEKAKQKARKDTLMYNLLIFNKLQMSHHNIFEYRTETINRVDLSINITKNKANTKNRSNIENNNGGAAISLIMLHTNSTFHAQQQNKATTAKKNLN
jgi:predicted secreted protein